MQRSVARIEIMPDLLEVECPRPAATRPRLERRSRQRRRSGKQLRCGRRVTPDNRLDQRQERGVGCAKLVHGPSEARTAKQLLAKMSCPAVQLPDDLSRSPAQPDREDAAVRERRWRARAGCFLESGVLIRGQRRHPQCPPPRRPPTADRRRRTFARPTLPPVPTTATRPMLRSSSDRAMASSAPPSISSCTGSMRFARRGNAQARPLRHGVRAVRRSCEATLTAKEAEQLLAVHAFIGRRRPVPPAHLFLRRWRVEP